MGGIQGVSQERNPSIRPTRTHHQKAISISPGCHFTTRSWCQPRLGSTNHRTDQPIRCNCWTARSLQCRHKCHYSQASLQHSRCANCHSNQPNLQKCNKCTWIRCLQRDAKLKKNSWMSNKWTWARNRSLHWPKKQELKVLIQQLRSNSTVTIATAATSGDSDQPRDQHNDVKDSQGRRWFQVKFHYSSLESWLLLQQQIPWPWWPVETNLDCFDCLWDG